MSGGDWHLEKKFGIMVISSMLFQAGAIVWYASQTESRITSLESRPDLTERVIVLETLQGEQNKINRQFQLVLDRLIETMNMFGNEQSKRTKSIERIDDHEKDFHRK